MERQRILITGGTGSLGSALVKKWYAEGHLLTIISKDPHRQHRMTSLYPDIHYVLADICNEREVLRACEGQDVLVSAAALKDVATGEYHPSEFIRVNVIGSETVAYCWHQTHKDGQGKALLVSSDKAVSALNLYGVTKAASTSVFRKYDYSVIRYGNVVESNGSFLNKWKQAIAAGKPIKVREPEPTRFLLRMDDAIALIEDALDLIERNGNGIFVPHGLKAFSVWQAAAALKVPVEYEPLLPYEKRNEQLVAEGEIPVQESELLSRIKPGWSEEWLRFRSDNVTRMTGREILEALGWQKNS
jgi:FlaA1/EpsC-like NDP-sugar epimerase